MTTDGNQIPMRLAFGVHSAPRNAPPHILRQVESEAQALAVSILAGHHKLEYIGACIGKSKAYVSRLQNGKRAIPDKLIGPLCAATGSNLLRQFIDLQRAMERQHQPIQRLASLLAEVA